MLRELFPLEAPEEKISISLKERIFFLQMSQPYRILVYRKHRTIVVCEKRNNRPKKKKKKNERTDILNSMFGFFRYVIIVPFEFIL